MELKNKKIMILGAGKYQTPLINKAKEMNLEVHVCSISGNYPGIPFASFFHEVDISVPKKILALAKKLDIDGIITTATDVCLESIGLVVEKLNLSGTNHTNSIACLNKSKMKERFFKNDVPTPKYSTCEEIEHVIHFFNNSESHCVLKPVDSSGSRGVHKVENINDIEFAFLEAQKFSKSKNIIIEEWVEGEEFGAQVVVLDNKVVMLILHSDLTTPPPHRIPIAHGCPHYNERELLSPVTECITKAINSLGINNTICNVDLILTDEGPQIIEVTSRMGGTYLPEICGNYWGIDMYKLAIEISLGIKPIIPIRPTGKPNAAHKLIINRLGTISKYGQMSDKYSWDLWFKEGDGLPSGNNFREIGYVQVFGTDPARVLNEASNAAKLFQDTSTISGDNQ